MPSPTAVCLGNGLADAAVLAAMHEQYRAGAELPLAERLLGALERAL